MKINRQITFAGIALLILTACSKDPIEPPMPDPNPQDGITEGTGIDDLHGTQTDKPAYRRH